MPRENFERARFGSERLRMSDNHIVREAVEVLDISGGSKKLRPVHTIGIGAKGYFVASDVARDYCIAEHFRGRKFQ